MICNHYRQQTESGRKLPCATPECKDGIRSESMDVHEEEAWTTERVYRQELGPIFFWRGDFLRPVLTNG